MVYDSNTIDLDVVFLACILGYHLGFDGSSPLTFQRRKQVFALSALIPCFRIRQQSHQRDDCGWMRLVYPVREESERRIRSTQNHLNRSQNWLRKSQDHKIAVDHSFVLHQAVYPTYSPVFQALIQALHSRSQNVCTPRVSRSYTRVSKPVISRFIISSLTTTTLHCKYEILNHCVARPEDPTFMSSIFGSDPELQHAGTLDSASRSIRTVLLLSVLQRNLKV